MDTALQAPATRQPRVRSWMSALYPAVWRWHFWSGLLITPALIIVSLTGALYVFHKEIEHLLRRDLYFVDAPAGAEPLAYSAQVAAAQTYVGAEWEFHGINQSAAAGRSTEVILEREEGAEHIHRSIHVNPYTGAILGERSFDDSFFSIVLRIHRTLLAGTTGRIIIELATCWGIVSLLTGLLLWWPRTKEKVWGVWLPRLRRGAKTALRDLHTLPGLYLMFFTFVIMFTGLLYTSVWGRAFFAGLYVGGQLPAPYVSPPKSTPLPEGATPVSIDAVMQEARRHYPFEVFSLQASHEGSSWNIYSPSDYPYRPGGVVYIDDSTGATLATIDYPSLGLGAKTALMFYPIHTGSIFGLPTKILAVLTCLVIIAMSITGVWMWWRRRPAGTFGSPRKTSGEQVPRLVIATILVLAVLFPLVGLSLIAAALLDFSLRFLPSRRKAVSNSA